MDSGNDCTDVIMGCDSDKLSDDEDVIYDVEYCGHSEPVYVIAIDSSDDCRYLATGSQDHTAILWSIEHSMPVGQTIGHVDTVTHIIFSKQGDMATADMSGVIAVWLRSLFPSEPSGGSTIHSLAASWTHAISTDLVWLHWETRDLFSFFLVGCGEEDGRILRIIKYNNNDNVETEATECYDAKGVISCILFRLSSETPVLLVSLHVGGTLRFWDVVKMQQLSTCSLVQSGSNFQHGGSVDVNSLVLINDIIAVASQDGKVFLVTTRKDVLDCQHDRTVMQYTVAGSMDSVEGLQFIPNSTYFAFCTNSNAPSEDSNAYDGIVGVFDYRFQSMRCEGRYPTGLLNLTVLQKENTYLLTASIDGFIILWRSVAENLHPLQVVKCQNGPIYDVKILGDPTKSENLHAFTCGESGTVRFHTIMYE